MRVHEIARVMWKGALRARSTLLLAASCDRARSEGSAHTLASEAADQRRSGRRSSPYLVAEPGGLPSWICCSFLSLKMYCPGLIRGSAGFPAADRSRGHGAHGTADASRASDDPEISGMVDRVLASKREVT